MGSWMNWGMHKYETSFINRHWQQYIRKQQAPSAHLPNVAPASKPGSDFKGLVNECVSVLSLALLDGCPDTVNALGDRMPIELINVRDAVFAPHSSCVSMKTSANIAVPSTARWMGRLLISDTVATGTRVFTVVNVNSPSFCSCK